MPGYFITGTDTGVGKTLVGGAIARALMQGGKRVGVFKPCESGCRVQGSRLIPEDALFLKSMAGCSEAIETICPYRLQRPLAPLVAARLEQVAIDLEKIQAAYHRLQERHDIVLAEGAGGLLVPLTDACLTVDLVRMLGLPLVIVSRLSLGTINHTLLTVRQALHSGISIAGIIFNQLSPEAGLAEETSPDVINKFSRVRIIGRMPFITGDKRNDPDFLANLAAQHLELSVFATF